MVFSEWTDWEFTNGCPLTCGGGQALREKQCMNGVIPMPAEACGGGPDSEMATCNDDRCPGNLYVE